MIFVHKHNFVIVIKKNSPKIHGCELCELKIKIVIKLQMFKNENKVK